MTTCMRITLQFSMNNVYRVPLSLSLTLTYIVSTSTVSLLTLDPNHALFPYPITLRYTNYNSFPSATLTLLLLKVRSPLSVMLTHAQSQLTMTLSLHKLWPPPSRTLTLTLYKVGHMYFSSVTTASQYFTVICLKG